MAIATRCGAAAFFAASALTSSLGLPIVSAFQVLVPKPRPLVAATVSTSTSAPVPATTSSTALHGKAWNKLGIDEDPEGEFHWYMLNCIAGSELELLRQCKTMQPTLKETDCQKFVVPQERQLRSHGQKNVVDVKALFPGYVFAKLRLCPETYEAIQAIPLTRSWMGTVHMKGMKRLPVIPVALNEDEIEKFNLLEEETDAMFAKYGEDYDGRGDAGKDLLHQYAGYEVDNMVKVLTGKHKGEDGVVKRLKNGKIKVRLYTYGTTFDEWYNVEEIRPMTDAEILKGLTGPEAPVRQDEFDVSIGKKPKDYGRRGAVDDRRRGSLRSDLYSSLGGGRGGRGGDRRNTREARRSRGDAGFNSKDRFGRSDKDLQEEERNWREYREQQRAEKREGSWGMTGDKPWMYEETVDVTNEDEETMGDVDAQWGRGGDIRSGRQERRMRRQQGQGQEGGGRGSRQWQRAGPSRSEGVERAIDGGDDWTSFAQDPGAKGGSSESDDFFDSLLNELSDTLDSPVSSDDASAPQSSDRGQRRRGDSGSSDDDFFASLMEEGTATRSGSSASKGGDDDDFFASLMDDLSDTLDSSSTSSSGASSGSKGASSGGDDAFFASLEQDLSESLSSAGPSSPPSSSPPGGSNSDDDFFASLEADLNDALGQETSGATSDESSAGDIFDDLSKDIASGQEDFFNDLADDIISDAVAAEVKKPAPKRKSLAATPAQDFSSLTVPVLKGMLKERGLKVSGKKAELIDRLQSS